MSFTNRSVDEALEGFKKAAKKCIPIEFETGIKEGRIIRKGVSVFPKEPFIQNSDEVIFKIRKGLQEELGDVGIKIKDSENAVKLLKELKSISEHINRLRGEINRLKGEINREEEIYKNNDCKIGK